MAFDLHFNLNQFDKTFAQTYFLREGTHQNGLKFL